LSYFAAKIYGAFSFFTIVDYVITKYKHKSSQLSITIRSDY